LRWSEPRVAPQTMALESARALDAAEYRDLIERLERLYGKKFEVTRRVDRRSPSAAWRLLIGDRRIDANRSPAASMRSARATPHTDLRKLMD